MKICKINNIQEFMLEKIAEHKAEEDKALKKKYLLKGLIETLVYIMPSFTAMIFLFVDDQIKVIRAFSILTLFSLMEEPFNQITQALQSKGLYEVSISNFFYFLKNIPQRTNIDSQKEEM